MSDTDQDTIDDLSGKIADLERELELVQSELVDKDRKIEDYRSVLSDIAILANEALKAI
jgi:hypothetical protein